MNKFYALLALIFVSHFSLADAFADDNEIQPLKKPAQQKKEKLPELKSRAKVQRPVKKPASATSRENVEPYPYHSYPADYKLGLLVGISNLQSGDTNAQIVRDQAQIAQNFFVGANLEAVPFRYFGAEVEGFYGIAPSQNTQDLFGNTVQRSLKQMGGMGALKAQLPFEAAGLIFVPKLGGGYGFWNLQYTNLGGLSNTQVETRAMGFYGVAGIDIDLGRFLVLTADYAMSLGATGSYLNNGALTNIPSAFYDRLRVGAYIRLLPFMGAGVQWVRRSFYSNGAVPTTADGSPTGNEAQNQFLGHLVFEF